MTRIIKIYFLTISLVFFTFCYQTKIEEEFTQTKDELNILTIEEKNTLDEKILDLKNNLGPQIAILIIDSTGSKSIEEYSIDYVEKWKIGRKYYNDGLLILVVRRDRKVRIEVGYGLEKIIRDEIAYKIIKEKMIPNLKNDEIFKATLLAIEEINILIKKNPKLIGDQEGINSRWDSIKGFIKK